MSVKQQLIIEIDTPRLVLMQELISKGDFRDYDHFISEMVELLGELYIESGLKKIEEFTEDSQILIQTSRLRTLKMADDLNKYVLEQNQLEILSNSN